MHKGGYVYIITNKNNSVPYIGVTSDIVGRIWEHKNKIHPTSFSARYQCDKLVYYSYYDTIERAIEREKALKGGSRNAKVALINNFNLAWVDLYESL